MSDFKVSDMGSKGERSNFGRVEDGFQKREDLRAGWGVFTFLGGMRGRESEEPDSQACR